MVEPAEDVPDEMLDDDALPVCLKCFTPYEPLQHYCKTCGEAVGRTTPYIPFVNIPFNVGIFGTMWKRSRSDAETALCWRVVFVALIILFTPILLFGLPFVLLAKRRTRGEGVPPGDGS